MILSLQKHKYKKTEDNLEPLFYRQSSVYPPSISFMSVNIRAWRKWIATNLLDSLFWIAHWSANDELAVINEAMTAIFNW